MGDVQEQLAASPFLLINKTALRRPPQTSSVHLFFLETSSLPNSF